MKRELKNIPEDIKQSIAIVETVNGKGAVSDHAIQLSIDISNNKISHDEAVELILKHYNV